MIPIALHEKAVQNSFYTLKRNRISTVALTSARRHEDVSAFTYALARRAAAAGVKTLLVDFNMKHPDQSQNLALEDSVWSPGHAFTKSNIVSLSNTNLSVLGAPCNVQDTWSFQNQHKLHAMLRDMEMDYDLIIADMPSLLDHETERQTEILCAAFEHTLLVTMASQTVETDISSARDLLEKGGANIMGAVMNDKYTPSMVDELIRQINKTRPILRLTLFQKMFERINQWLRKNAFLNQSL